MISTLSNPRRWLARLPLGRAVRACLAIGALLALGIALALAPLSWALAGLVASAGAVALLLRPELGALLLAFAIPFGSLREFHLGSLTLGLSEVLVWGMLAGWAVRRMALPGTRLLRLPLTGAVLAFLAWAFVALWPAQALAPALKELAKWVEFLLLYLFIGGTLDLAARRRLWVALLIAGMCQAALGLYQFLFRVGPEGFVLFGRYMRAYGTFSQPNPFGGYLGLTLPLAYAAVWAGPRHARLRWLLALAASALLGAGLVASWSRGALVGLAGGLGLSTLALGRRVWPILFVVALLLLLLAPALQALLPGGFMQRLDDMVAFASQDLATVEIDDANFALVERLAHWQAAWRMFEQHPWMGVGLGQYATVYPQVALPRWRDPLGHAHNYYLNILAEGGLLGLAAYLLLLATALVTTWRQARRTHGWERALAIGALGLLGHLLAHSLFDNLYVHEMYLLVAMALGLAVPIPTRPLPHEAPAPAV